MFSFLHGNTSLYHHSQNGPRIKPILAMVIANSSLCNVLFRLGLYNKL